MTSGPGSDIRCPTCHQLTVPGAFCTRCGSALPFDLVNRPAAENRSAVQERLRARQEGHPGVPVAGAETFEPEPTDALRQAEPAEVPEGELVPPLVTDFDAPPVEPDVPGSVPAADVTAEPATSEPPVEDPASRPGASAAIAAAPGTPSAVSPRPAFLGDPEPEWPAEPDLSPSTPAEPEPEWHDTPDAEPEWEVVPSKAAPPLPYSDAGAMAAMEHDGGSGRPPTGSDSTGGGDGGISPAVFIAFLVLGLVALLGGAALAGFFRDGGIAQASPTPTASVEVSPSPSLEATPSPSLEPSPTILPSDAPPTTFPDGFLARAETCAEKPTAPSCDNSGATNSGSLWVLVSFRHAGASDVIGFAIVDSAGNLQADASLDLGFCGTSTDCAGYTYHQFSGLAPGDYRVRVTRNGTPAAETTFSVLP